jgi:hypothetical protein
MTESDRRTDAAVLEHIRQHGPSSRKELLAAVGAGVESSLTRLTAARRLVRGRDDNSRVLWSMAPESKSEPSRVPPPPSVSSVSVAELASHLDHAAGMLGDFARWLDGQGMAREAGCVRLLAAGCRETARRATQLEGVGHAHT